MPTSRLNPGETRGILEAIFESAVDGIIVIDARARVEAFNPGQSACLATPSRK